MNALKIISIILMLATCISCEPTVSFTEPQPSGVDNLSMFPNRLQGQYLSLSDKSILSVSDKLIRRTYDYDYKTHPDQLDSNSRLVGDTIINLQTNEKTMVKHDGDSIVNHIHEIDTLVQLNYDNVLRKLKGYYFINTRYDEESWEVRKMELSKGQLIISSITAKSDIDNLKEITESVQDTVPPYTFSATKKQFSKFVKQNGFSDREMFIRQE